MRWTGPAASRGRRSTYMQYIPGALAGVIGHLHRRSIILFVSNLEHGQAGKYSFGTWAIEYKLHPDVEEGYSLPILWDNEQHFAQDVSRRLDILDGGASIEHYSFGVQDEDLGLTDVLRKYRVLGREACGAHGSAVF